MTRGRRLFHLTALGAPWSVHGDAPFIHLCWREQLAGVRSRFFGDGAVRVWIVDPSRLEKLVVEDSYGHGAYPHHYGELPAVAVVGFVDVASSDSIEGALSSVETSSEEPDRG